MLFDSNHTIAPRELSETVTLVQRRSVTDDHGMQAYTPGEVVCTVPASVSMLSGYAKIQYYDAVEVEAYEVRMRFVPCKFNEIEWRGARLVVDSTEDEGMRGRWLRVRCSRRDDR